MQDDLVPENVRALEQRVCREMYVSIDQIRGKDRFPEIVAARHKVWHLAYTELGYSMARIGRIYGRDHTTIKHGIHRCRKGEG